MLSLAVSWIYGTNTTTAHALDPDLSKAMLLFYHDTGSVHKKTDKALRTGMLMVKGDVLYNESSISRVVLEAVTEVCERVQSLVALFGERTEQNVVIICSYLETVSAVQAGLYELRRNNDLTIEQLPHVATVASFQGSQRNAGFFMTSIGGACSKPKELGFFRDPHPLNAALTRMGHVRVIVAGACKDTPMTGKSTISSRIAEYKGAHGVLEIAGMYKREGALSFLAVLPTILGSMHSDVLGTVLDGILSDPFGWLISVMLGEVVGGIYCGMIGGMPCGKLTV